MIWLPVVPLVWVISALVKALLFVPSGLGVLFSIAGDGWKRTPRMWRWAADSASTSAAYKTRWGTFWFWAVQNPVKMMVIEQPATYVQAGGIDENKPGLQWRWRRYKGLASFRVAWGEPRADKGKKEFYIGWKIGSPSPCKFTAQLRPF